MVENNFNHLWREFLVQLDPRFILGELKCKWD